MRKALAAAVFGIVSVLACASPNVWDPEAIAQLNGVAEIGPPADQISPTWEKPEPNKADFRGVDGTCGWNGDGTDPDTFVRKNRSDVPGEGQLHDVEWSAIHNLPFPKDKPLRINWSQVNIQQIAKYEGAAVRTIGYIVAIKPQNGGKGEGTNCHFTLASETDTHIAFVGTSGDAEKNSVVVEFTPRFLQSHPNWTKATLTNYLNKDIPVRISGWLMFDPDHRNHLGKYRFTLWEIHPITTIEVFENNQWRNIDGN